MVSSNQSQNNIYIDNVIALYYEIFIIYIRYVVLMQKT